MDFMKLLQSLEEFLYEAMSWIIFYPRAIVRTVRHPVAVSVYTREQLKQPRELQFTEMISPPLLLILTVILTHVIELATPSGVGTVTSAMGRQLYASDQGIVATRSTVYCVFALIGSLTWLRQERLRVDRETLRAPFYVHCYLLAPFVLGISIATSVAINTPLPWSLGAVPLLLASCTWYAWAQTAIYARLLDVSLVRGFLLACRANIVATIIFGGLAVLIFGTPAAH